MAKELSYKELFPDLNDLTLRNVMPTAILENQRWWEDWLISKGWRG
jgi:hypothetical protein